MDTMSAMSAPPKLPVWQTVRASYTIVAHNFGQLVRICWLGILIMVPVYAALDRFEEMWSRDSGAQATYHWLREITAALPSPVDLPFLASIAVGWHRLVLREERVTQPVDPVGALIRATRAGLGLDHSSPILLLPSGGVLL